MSRSGLQRLVVRMLFDPEFAVRALRDPEAVLAGEAITEPERAWLLRPDPRAWRTDPERPVRALAVLLQEYPASAALAVASGGVDDLRAYFASGRFHAVIRDRGSMAIAFGDYLVDLAAAGRIRDGRVAALARLEQAIAVLRRSYRPPRPSATGGDRAGADSDGGRGAPGERLRFSLDKALHAAPAGTADLHDEIRNALGVEGAALPQAVLGAAEPGCRGRLSTRALDPEATEPLLLELQPDEGPRVKVPVGIAEITAGLYGILAFASDPRERAALEAEAVRLGCAPEDAAEVLQGLVEDGLLVPA